MTQRIQHMEPYVAELQAIVVLHWCENILSIRCHSKVYGGAHPISQFQVSRHKIGVEVSQGGVPKLKACFARVLYVLIQVARGVHHDDHPTFRIKCDTKHGRSIPNRTGEAAWTFSYITNRCPVRGE